MHQNVATRDILSVLKQRSYTNCSNDGGVIRHVERVATAQCYLHQVYPSLPFVCLS
jgi:hypothetical protein